MKIFLDDEREIPESFGEGWVIARNYDELTKLVGEDLGVLEAISFDHDLGEAELDGHEIAITLESAAAFGFKFHPDFTMHIHTANPAGRYRLEAARHSIFRYIGRPVKGETYVLHNIRSYDA